MEAEGLSGVDIRLPATTEMLEATTNRTAAFKLIVSYVAGCDCDREGSLLCVKKGRVGWYTQRTDESMDLSWMGVGLADMSATFCKVTTLDSCLTIFLVGQCFGR